MPVRMLLSPEFQSSGGMGRRMTRSTYDGMAGGAANFLRSSAILALLRHNLKPLSIYQ